MRKDKNFTALLTTRDVAEKLDLSEQTLWDMRRKGKGPSFFRLGRSVRYSEDAVETWLKQRIVS